MDRLYPIIRRARRPLIIEDDDAGPPPGPPPEVPLVEAEEPVSYARPAKPKGKHGDAAKSGRKG